MEYRWLTNDEIMEWVQPVCEQRGWARLNVNDLQPTCRVRGAFDGSALVGFLVLQMFPVIGPGFSDADHRDGVASRALADQVHDFLVEAKCRGALTICESPVTERLAQRHGMVPVQEKVYIWNGVEG